MAKLTIVTGVSIILLSVIFIFLINTVSIKTVTPALIGFSLLFMGLLALRESWRPHAIHVAGLVAMFGIICSLGALWQFFLLLFGEAPQYTLIPIAGTVVFLLCTIFLIFAIRSFIQARQAKKSLERLRRML